MTLEMERFRCLLMDKISEDGSCAHHRLIRLVSKSGKDAG